MLQFCYFNCVRVNLIRRNEKKQNNYEYFTCKKRLTRFATGCLSRIAGLKVGKFYRITILSCDFQFEVQHFSVMYNRFSCKAVHEGNRRNRLDSRTAVKKGRIIK